MEKSLDKTIEIAERMAFLQLDSSGVAALKSSKALIDRELPLALDKFYDQVRKTPAVARFFSSPDHMNHAKSAQQGHWQNISNGDFNEDYAAKVRSIGTVHARIGLEPRWYIGGYAIVADHLIRAAVTEEIGKSRFFGHGEKTAIRLGNAIGALIKAVFLDMDLAISIYAEQAEADKKKAQEAAIKQERELVSQSFGTALKQIANNDLTCRINDALPEAYEPLRNDFNNSIAQLEAMIEQIGEGAVAIRSSTAELSEAANHCSRRTEMQAASLEESASALRQVTEAMKETTQRARDVQTMVDKAMTETTQSGSVLGRTIGAMGAIESSSREIGNILSVIDEIAFQTNLLALNAGVEAARAGEAGRGFAVVAQEVRELAQRSASAARQIKSLISSSAANVKEGVELVGETGKSLEAIASEVNVIKGHVASIVSSTREQETALQEINQAMQSLDRATQENSGMVEESTAATHALAGEADMIANLLARFTIKMSGANARAERHMLAPGQRLPRVA